MAGSINKVILVGNLGRDPETRTFNNGGKVVSLRVATADSWKDKQTGERREATEWHSVSIFGEGLANVAEKYLRKGSKVYLEGQLKTRKWQDKDGNDRYSTEVVLQGFGSALVLLDSKGGDGGGGGGGYNQGGYNNQSGYSQGSSNQGQGDYNAGDSGGADPFSSNNGLDDEVPF